MKIEKVSKALKELGHPVRLTIYKFLIRCGHKGVPVGKIQENLSIPNSTLSHHISSLMSADLISQRREGRVLYCVAEYDNLELVINFLKDECCLEENEKDA